MTPHSRGLLHRYLTQTLWTCDRLYHVGYDVAQGCPLCGHHRDDLHHRLFHCPGSEDSRHHLLQAGDVDHLRLNPHLLFGCQLLPVLPQNRPPGYGHEQYCSHTADGRPVKEHFKDNTVYTDGSCSKTAHSSMNTAGWAVIALDSDGNLAAAIWGQVGRRLPQTSPASEYVAGMAAAEHQVQEVRCDFRGLAALGTSSLEALAFRKNPYSGLRVQIKGRAPQASFIKVPAHVDPSSCVAGSPSWRDAVGNQMADLYAKQGANLHLQPSSDELSAFSHDRDVLTRFLTYVPSALSLWEPVGPASGTRKHPAETSDEARSRTGRWRTLLPERRSRTLGLHRGLRGQHSSSIFWGLVVSRPPPRRRHTKHNLSDAA